MNRLFVDELLSVGVVEAGDNPEARIVMYKAAPQDQTAESGTTSKGDGMEFDLTALPDEQRAAVESVITESRDRIAELEAQLAANDDVEKMTEDVTKSADPEVQAIIKAQEDRISELAKSLDTERQARRQAEFIEKAKPLASLLGKADQVGPVLAEIAAAAPDAYKRLESALTAAAQRVEKGGLFDSFGTDGEANTDPIAKRDAYVTEYQKNNPGVSQAEARAAFWASHPDMKKEARL